MSEAQRLAVVEEAKSWLHTPYHHMGRVKGAGIDCATLLLEVYEKVGVLPHVELNHYPPDWMLHRDEERYLMQALQLSTEVPEPTGPGDVVLVKVGRCFSHGAIVIDWPLCIHASVGLPVSYVDALQDACFRSLTGELRPMKFFTLWDNR